LVSLAFFAETNPTGRASRGLHRRGIILRVALSLIDPIVFPWRGDTGTFVSPILLLSAPSQFLNAFFLWQYATKSQHLAEHKQHGVSILFD